MKKMNRRRTVTIEVDEELATAYKAAYADAFGAEQVRRQSLATFMTGFVEDRLSEELEFAASENQRASA